MKPQCPEPKPFSNFLLLAHRMVAWDGHTTVAGSFFLLVFACLRAHPAFEAGVRGAVLPSPFAFGIWADSPFVFGKWAD